MPRREEEVRGEINDWLSFVVQLLILTFLILVHYGVL